MKKKVIVVGAGLGGLSAAIRLSADGYDVTVVEKSERIGGKLNIRSGKGFSFDTGPSILTMPWVLEQLFDSAGRNIHDYLTIERIEPQWRTFFQDGTQIDLTSDLPRMLQQLQELAPEDIEGFFDYLSYANKMYESNLKSFYKKFIWTARFTNDAHGKRTASNGSNEIYGCYYTQIFFKQTFASIV